MKNKKGDGHVDWIISIGFFLVFLLSIFVIIKPGIIPVHDYDTLLDIVEEHVKEDIRVSGVYNQNPENFDFGGLYWTLYKVPLFFNKFPDGKCIKIDFPYEVDNNKINVYRVYTDPTTKEKIWTALSRSLSDKLYIEEASSFIQPNTEYIIFFSDNEVYSKETPGDSDLNAISDPGNCIDSGDGVNFEYNLGINEKIRGLSKYALDFLNSGSFWKIYYEQIKHVYDYPSSKEFSIIITRDNKLRYEYKTKDPGVKINVYSREWSDFILNYDGTRTPIKLNIKIW